MPPDDGCKDVAIDVGVGIADDGLVGFGDLSVLVQVHEVHIACEELMRVTGIVDRIEVAVRSCCTSLSIGSEDAFRLISVEQCHRIAHLREDIVLAIDGRERIEALRQLGHLILIVAHGSAHLDAPILCDNRLGSDGGLEALILQLATITPVEVDTSDGVGEGLLCQEVIGLVEEVVELHAQAVVQQIALQSDVELLGRLPLDLIVTDVGELGTDGVGVVANGSVAGAGGIVADAVVTADVEASIHAQVVNA